MNKIYACLVVFAFFNSSAILAFGRGSRIDATLDLCPVALSSLQNNGSVRLDMATYPGLVPLPNTCDAAQIDFANPTPLSINYYGTRYNSVFVNENGLLTFGAASAATSTADLLNLGLPAIAALLTDFDYVNGAGSVRYGWGPIDTGPGFFISYGVRSSSTSSDFSRIQVGFINIDNATGDFDLEFNFDKIVFDGGGATAGFTSGAGQGLVFAGAGVAGAYRGDSSLNTCEIGSNPLPCNNFGVPPGTTDRFGVEVIGRYVYQFRNGVPVGSPPIDVPEPASMILFGLGLGALGMSLKNKRKNKA
jgi:PEP-CTERM motif